MTAGFKASDKSYIIESNRLIRECSIVRSYENMYIIRFESGELIRIKEHRLFARIETIFCGLSTCYPHTLKRLQG